VILVIAEQKDGKLNRASLETIAAAQQLSMPMKIAVAGQGVGPDAAELAQYGEVIAVDHARRSATTRRTPSSRRCSKWSNRQNPHSCSCRTLTRLATSHRRSRRGSIARSSPM
jgi:electron transfer flavoprotein alpha subunit